MRGDLVSVQYSDDGVWAESLVEENELE